MIGTPITGRSVWAATMPGSAVDIPAAAMIRAGLRMWAFLAYSATAAGSRCADSTHLEADATLLQLGLRGLSVGFSLADRP